MFSIRKSIPQFIQKKNSGSKIFFSEQPIETIEDFIDFRNYRVTGRPLKKPTPGKQVFLNEDCCAVVKTNRIKSLTKQVQIHFGFEKSAGYYCLTNEFKNLIRLSSCPLVPRVYGYGYRGFPFLKEEILITEYFDNACTLDKYIKLNFDKCEWILKQVIDLFITMLSYNFVHMDPNPGNIVVLPDTQLKFVDLESVSFNSNSNSVCLALTVGFFYHFWFHKFMQEREFDKLSIRLLKSSGYSLDLNMLGLYHRMKSKKLPRNTKFQIVNSQKLQKSFIGECSLGPEDEFYYRNLL
jgi:hypothetical protein